MKCMFVVTLCINSPRESCCCVKKTFGPAQLWTQFKGSDGLTHHSCPAQTCPSSECRTCRQCWRCCSDRSPNLWMPSWFCPAGGRGSGPLGLASLQIWWAEPGQPEPSPGTPGVLQKPGQHGSEGNQWEHKHDCRSSRPVCWSVGVNSHLQTLNFYSRIQTVSHNGYFLLFQIKTGWLFVSLN